MASSLWPAVGGATRGFTRRATTLHGVGLFAGAVIMSLALALAGAFVGVMGLRNLLLLLVYVALALAVLQSVGVPLPQSRWQVPEYWRRMLDADVLPVAYGAILGFGAFTSVVVGAFWVFLAATTLHTALVALIGWLAYAAGRISGFCFGLRHQPVERIFLTRHQRQALVIATTALAIAAVVA
jgi:hypothetical protein